jgi:hypothetical protein
VADGAGEGGTVVSLSPWVSNDQRASGTGSPGTEGVGGCCRRKNVAAGVPAHLLHHIVRNPCLSKQHVELARHATRHGVDAKPAVKGREGGEGGGQEA